MKTIGLKIRELRRQKGLSQEELGFEISVTRQTVSKWEADTMQPTTENLKVLCDFFGVKSTYFLDESFDKNDETVSTIPTTQNKSNSNRKTIVYSVLLALSIVIFIVCLIIGIIATSILLQPPLGDGDTHLLHFDWLVIFCSVMVLFALITIIVLICVLIRKKKQNVKSC